MTNIIITNLITVSTNGADLFDDSESFLRDLSENELDLLGGGKYFQITTPDVVPILPTPPMRELL
jgi:hypothetical protein